MKRKRFWISAIMLLSLFSLAACNATKLTLTSASLKPKGTDATPAISLPANADPAYWEDTLAPQFRDKIQDIVYGYLPDAGRTHIIDRKVLDEAAFNGSAVLHEIIIETDITFADETIRSEPLQINLLLPKNATAPVPLITMQTFCANKAVFPHPEVSFSGRGFNCGNEGGGLMGFLIPNLFGRYITTPPIEDIMEAGYGLMTMHPPELIADDGQAGLFDLSAYSEGYNGDPNDRWGAIGAWGWLWSRAIDAVIDMEEVDPNGIILYGHSRYGKSALVTAAFDPRVDAVISHQSGTGGASLSRKKPGETVKDITEGYPHWFSRDYASYSDRTQDLPIDQHYLIALVAPRPLFLGNARRDVWSDPNGAFRAAKAANTVYQLYGKDGLTAPRLDDFRPQDAISFWIRPGTHGVVKEDWPAFLEFLDAHFKTGPSENSTAGTD